VRVCRQYSCFQCLLIIRRHPNVIQYKESQYFTLYVTQHQWRFYVGARGHSPLPQILPRPPNDKLLNTGQLDTVVLLLVDVIGSFRLAVVAPPPK